MPIDSKNEGEQPCVPILGLFGTSHMKSWIRFKMAKLKRTIAFIFAVLNFYRCHFNYSSMLFSGMQAKLLSFQSIKVAEIACSMSQIKIKEVLQIFTVSAFFEISAI